MTDTAEQVVLTITGVDHDTAYQAAGALSELIVPAADAVSIYEEGTDWRIDAYYCDEAAGKAAHDLLRDLCPLAADQANLAPVEQRNWVALSQSALPPVYAGRFTICGSHDLHRVRGGGNTILVEAGEAFGTAHHATTYGCLLAIDRLTHSQSFRSILDLGTGSGVLSLAMQRALPRASIIASDIDPRSIEVAAENAARNNLSRLSGGPHFVVADGLSDEHIVERAPFDLIVANILARPLIALAPTIAAALDQGATLILSGILVPQAREVCARYASLGVVLQSHERHHGWSTLVMRRRPAGRRR